MDKLDMFQDRFGKIDGFGWWYLEIIQADAGAQFTSTEFQTNVKPAVFGLRYHLRIIRKLTDKLK